MKNKSELIRNIISIAIIIMVIVLIFTDAFLKINDVNDFDIIKTIEIALSIALTINLSFSMNFNINKQINNLESKIKNSGDKNNQNNINGNNNNVFNLIKIDVDPNEIVKSVDEYVNNNLKSIIKKSYELLNEEKVNIKNQDLIIKFLFDGRLINDETIQNIWAHLIKKESEEEGSISKRTLEIVKNMSHEEAIKFQNILKICFDDGFIAKNNKLCPNLDDILLFKDINLINSNDDLKKSVDLKPNRFVIIEIDNFYLFVKNNKEKVNEFYINSYFLTNSGKEILKSLNIKRNLDDIKTIALNIKNDFKDTFEVKLINQNDYKAGKLDNDYLIDL